MPNTSATGGILLPAPPPPADDAALDAIFQTLVSGITGLDGALVLPRWQPIPPKQPPVTTTWCAIGVTDSIPNDGPQLFWDPVAQIYTLWRHEQIDVLATFYGPASRTTAAQLRDGLSMIQNLDSLLPYNMMFVNVGDIRQVPELINEQWIRRSDMMLYFRRKVVRTYPVESLQIGVINLIDDTGAVDDWIFVPQGAIYVTDTGMPWTADSTVTADSTNTAGG